MTHTNKATRPCDESCAHDGPVPDCAPSKAAKARKPFKCVTPHGPEQLCYGCVVKYINPDKRCGHPKARDTKKKTWSAAGYCWGYATLVDAGKEKTAAEKLCPGCELWAPTQSPKEK